MEVAGKALVVDDDGELRTIVGKMLSALGYEVSLADTGEKALRIFLRTKFNFVLSDFEMPGMDGITLAHRIKKSSPCTPVVIMTGGARETVLAVDPVVWTT